MLLRPGAITAAEIADALGAPIEDRGEASMAPEAFEVADGRRAEPDAPPRTSGSMAAHYAPVRPLELVSPGELADRLAVLRDQGVRVVLWSRRRPAGHVGEWERAPGNARDYARVLYDALRRFDRLDVERIVLEAPPDGADGSLWAAVNDRLKRAAFGSGAASPPG
ncbi:MAG: Sua5 family C-terminal domain-containing protein [Burkholderiaceae bacterium]